MNFEIYAMIKREASAIDDFEMFVAERGYQDWMAEYSAATVIKILKTIWGLVHGENFKVLLKRLGRKMTEISALYAIPYRTVQSWAVENRNTTDYVLDLIFFSEIILLKK